FAELLEHILFSLEDVERSRPLQPEALEPLFRGILRGEVGPLHVSDGLLRGLPQTRGAIAVLVFLAVRDDRGSCWLISTTGRVGRRLADRGRGRLAGPSTACSVRAREARTSGASSSGADRSLGASPFPTFSRATSEPGRVSPRARSLAS